MIRVLVGDMFQSKAQTLVNTVNIVGVMGKGIALQFSRKLHPPNLSRIISLGGVHLCRLLA